LHGVRPQAGDALPSTRPSMTVMKDTIILYAI
jgi:hypothetical protein